MIYELNSKMDSHRSSFKGLSSCVVFVCVLLSDVCCITLEAPAEISVIRGATVTLSCTFTSSSRVTSLMSVDWTFKPQSAYPPEDDHFRGRVKWLGSPSRGEASIQLLNASLTDNGTYGCTVRNPPDIQGSPAHTVLTVSPKRLSLALTDVAVLLVFVLVPSGLITLVLLCRMLCPCWSVSDENDAVTHHSPIEVISGEEYLYKQKTVCCFYFKDSYYEPDYSLHEKEIAESQC
ncbi:Myelin protein P0 [Triplophysa tibetana]|uniref:Myelin protein P0 n=1 Tax=Triplophysa tibetana TaxID=1572043 RepID=A0A5A9MXJ9_9TELE|nr:Myelin protein P0 [Triplophysa tibetana]